MANKTNKRRGEETRTKIKEKIIEYIGVHGYPPTVREICGMVGLRSTSTVQTHLAIMLERGSLETDGEYGQTRAIRVPGYKFVKVEGETDGLAEQKIE